MGNPSKKNNNHSISTKELDAVILHEIGLQLKVVMKMLERRNS